MATNNRGASRRGNGRSSRNNNPEGRNQHSGLMGTARDNPLTTAAAVGGAVAAGLFLWSRRNDVSDQIARLSEQFDEWRDNMRPGAMASSEDTTGRTQREIAEEALTLKETGSSL